MNLICIQSYKPKWLDNITKLYIQVMYMKRHFLYSLCMWSYPICCTLQFCPYNVWLQIKNFSWKSCVFLYVKCLLLTYMLSDSDWIWRLLLIQISYSQNLNMKYIKLQYSIRIILLFLLINHTKCEDLSLFDPIDLWADGDILVEITCIIVGLCLLISITIYIIRCYQIYIQYKQIFSSISSYKDIFIKRKNFNIFLITISHILMMTLSCCYLIMHFLNYL